MRASVGLSESDRKENNEEAYYQSITAGVCQPWTNYVNNGNKFLIIGAVVSSEYSNI